MGSVCLPKCYILQTPGFGVVLNVRKKKQPTWISVSRRPSYVTNSISTTPTKFKSSFDEYLKAIESVRDDSEKKKGKKESGGHRKKLKDVAVSEIVPKTLRREETKKLKWSKASNFDKKFISYERSSVVAGKEEVGSKFRERTGVSSQKGPNNMGLKDSSSKNTYVDKTDVTSSKLVWKKSTPMDEKTLRREETKKLKWTKGSNFDEKVVLYERSSVVAEMEGVGGKLRERTGVSSQKGPNYTGSKDVSSKNMYVDTTAVASSKLVWKKSTPMDEKTLRREETKKLKWSKGSNFDEKIDLYERSSVVAVKEGVDGKLRERTGVSSQKGPNYMGSKDGSSKNTYVDTTAVTSSKLVWKKSTPMNEKTLRNEDSKKLKWSKGSNFDEKVVLYERSSAVAEVEGVGDKFRERTGVSSQKGPNNMGSKGGSCKNTYVDTTDVTSSKRAWKKSTPIDEITSDDELELERFVFQPSELLNDVRDSRRVTQMEMEERIQKLARCLNDADMEMPEWMFSKSMRSARIRFSDHSIMRIIQILGKLGNWRRVLQVVDWLQMHERFKSQQIRYVYTAALGVLGKARRPVEALNLFFAMQRYRSSYPDIVAYRSIAVTLGQAGHIKELFDVIDSMRSVPGNFKTEGFEDWDPRLEPDIVVYNAVLNACAKRKEWEGALWILQKLAESGDQPSSTTYGLLMEVMLECEKYDLVHEYFSQMQASCSPNALTYRVLVNTLWREGKPEEAIAAVQDMESRGLVGSASLYYDLARCLCSAGRREEALLQVDKICKVASKPLVVTYTGLMQACFDSGKVEDGIFIYNHMQKYCTPNLVTCNIMLKAYLGHGMFTEANQLFQEMIQSGRLGSRTNVQITPDVHTFNLVLEACIKENRWDDFNYAYDQMLLHGHPYNTKRHLWMVLQASKAGKVEVVETTWRHLMQASRVPPPALVKERFRLKMEDDDLVAAVSSVASHPPTHQQSFSKEAWSKFLADNAQCFKKEALEHIIREINVSMSNSDLPNLIYQNLRDSCAEFAGLDEPVAGRTHLTETPIEV